VSITPVTDSGAKRRIGDILLALGFASEDSLAKASAEQEQTGQPLGQILVEHGVITRLELASALAEQWSDNASIAPLPVPSATPRPTPQPHDDDRYAERLQEAVAELAQRVDATRHDEVDESRITELAERVEATVARTQRLEATIATLAESFDGVTGGVEEAFGVLQAGMSDLAVDLARLDTTVTDLREQPAVAPVDTTGLEQQLEEFALALRQLSERPVVDDEARRLADELAAAVDRLADRSALESLRGALGSLEQRVDEIGARDGIALELDSQRALLRELESAVADLRARPAGDPALDARLGRIETQLTDISSHAPAAAEVEALASRLSKTRDGQDDLGRAVEKLAGRLDELAKQKPGDAAPSALVTELAERLELLAADDGQRVLERRVHELEDRIRDAYVTNDDLSHALDRARVELRPEPVAPDPRIDRIDEDLEALRAEISRVEGIEARLGVGVVTPDELARALDLATEDLRQALPEPDTRIDRIDEELTALRNDIARMDAPSAEDTTARAELAVLADRIERLVTRDELAQAVTEVGAPPGDRSTGPDPRVDQLARDLDLLRDEIARIEPVPGAAADVDNRLAALVTRVEELGRERSDAGALKLELDALHGVVAASLTQDDLREALATVREELEGRPDPAPDPRVEQLVSVVETLRQGLDRPGDRDVAVAETIERLSDRLDAVELRAEPAPAEPLGVDTSDLQADVAALAARLDPLEALGARVDQLADPLVGSAPVDELRDELDARLAELARTVAEGLANASTSTPPRIAPETDQRIEAELERTRMAIERVSLHLGEHERAIAEMRGSRDMTQQLEEISARLDELGAGGPPASPGSGGTGASSHPRRSVEPDIEMRSVLRRLDDLEEAASIGREKLMNRLERIASSIDWRLRRLEDPGQETP
jgi:DNA repair exonuclease SbcCD ATPase subunit